MKFEKISRVTSSEVIVEQILDQVNNGSLKPGQKLPTEKEMSEMFGVCRASVREAVRALALMGHLEVHQGKGAYLLDSPQGEDPSAGRLGAALAAVDSLDLVDLRNLLECKAVALAADRATPAQLKEIEKALDKMEGCLGRPEEFYQADLNFHVTVTRASNNQVLMEMMNVIGGHMTKDRETFLGEGDLHTGDCLATAREVYRAVERGSAREAVGRMAEHLALVTDEIQRVIAGAPRPLQAGHARRNAQTGG